MQKEIMASLEDYLKQVYGVGGREGRGDNSHMSSAQLEDSLTDSNNKSHTEFAYYSSPKKAAADQVVTSNLPKQSYIENEDKENCFAPEVVDVVRHPAGHHQVTDLPEHATKENRYEEGSCIAAPETLDNHHNSKQTDAIYNNVCSIEPQTSTGDIDEQMDLMVTNDQNEDLFENSSEDIFNVLELSSDDEDLDIPLLPIHNHEETTLDATNTTAPAAEHHSVTDDGNKNTEDVSAFSLSNCATGPMTSTQIGQTGIGVPLGKADDGVSCGKSVCPSKNRSDKPKIATLSQFFDISSSLDDGASSHDDATERCNPLTLGDPQKDKRTSPIDADDWVRGRVVDNEVSASSRLFAIAVRTS